ncbi:MAG: hypothetical protein OEW39_04215, partial [Deltaproteobacteria bacterium]|nr:hypothetical protein [Deltaproteobacteria bacterium]
DTTQSGGESLRLEVSGKLGTALDWRADYLNGLQHLPGPADPTQKAGADLFRRNPLRRWLERPETDPAHPVSGQQVWWRHEVDRAWIRWSRAGLDGIAGRQPISFGAGRVWRPTDLFAGFSPLTLDREFKPGVDALLLRGYPGDFSALTAVVVASPRDEPEVPPSRVLHWRGQAGAGAEFTALAGAVRGTGVAGGSLELSGFGAGWRVEGLRLRIQEWPQDESLLSAGVDFQFSGGAVVLAEVYRATLGAETEGELLSTVLAPPYRQGGLPQLSGTVLALGVQKDLGGLWRWAYTVFGSALPDATGARHVSLLHQGALFYSVADEAEAVFSLLSGTGRGLDPVLGAPRSEFGHVPTALHLAFKFVL